MLSGVIERENSLYHHEWSRWLPYSRVESGRSTYEKNMPLNGKYPRDTFNAGGYFTCPTKPT